MVWLAPLLVACNMLCTSVFVDDSIFHTMGSMVHSLCLFLIDKHNSIDSTVVKTAHWFAPFNHAYKDRLIIVMSVGWAKKEELITLQWLMGEKRVISETSEFCLEKK